MIINYLLLTLTFCVTYLYGLFFIRLIFFFKIINNNKFYFFEKILLGLFFLSFFNLFANFFIKLQSPFIYLVLILLIFYELIYSYNQLKSNLKKILIYSLIFLPLMLILEIGYDGGLYHMPHSVILQNEKIIFGLTNLHNRYGLTGVYSYLVSPFWIPNFLNIYLSIGTIFYSLIFIFIFEINKKKSLHIFLLTIAALFFAFISTRYAPLSYTQLDYKFGVLFFISLFYGFLVLMSNQNVKKNNFFFFFLISTIFASTFKSSGVLLLIYPLLILIYLIKKNFFKIKRDFIYLIIPSLFFFLWVSKSFINSGCFFFPVKISCFNFNWSIDLIELNNLNLAILKWNGYINLFLENQSYKKNFYFYLIYLIIFIIFLIFFINFYYKNFLINFLKKNFNFNILIYFNLILLIILAVYFPNIKNFSTLISSKLIEDYSKIIKYEFFLLSIFSFLFFHFYFLLFCKFKNQNLFEFKFFNFSLLIPFLLVLIFITILFFYAQNPRFGIGVFLTLFSSLIFVILGLVKNVHYKPGYNILLIIFIILSGKYFIFNNFNTIKHSDIFFEKKTAPNVNVMPRKNFGFVSNQDNKCFAILYCYPYEEANLIELKFNYKMILRYK